MTTPEELRALLESPEGGRVESEVLDPFSRRALPEQAEEPL